MNNTAAISINDIYKMLIPLSSSNKRWLGEKLIADSKDDVELHHSNKLVFPKVKKNRRISDKTMSMVIGSMPDDFDFDKAAEEMWEDFAK